MNTITPDQLQMVLKDGTAYFNEGKVFTDETMKSLQMLLNVPTVGASGAIFGILLAFGVLFPNTQLMLLFPPIPIKAKYFVIGYGAILHMLPIWEVCCSVLSLLNTGEKLLKRSIDGNLGRNKKNIQEWKQSYKADLYKYCRFFTYNYRINNRISS
jgi:hypothetical protein